MGNQWGWERKELQDAGINNSEDDKGVRQFDMQCSYATYWNCEGEWRL